MPLLRGSERISPWYLVRGGLGDHAYENCPAIQSELRGEQRRYEEAYERHQTWVKKYPEMNWPFDRQKPEIVEGMGSLNPDLEMCGWCARVWKARNRRAS